MNKMLKKISAYALTFIMVFGAVAATTGTMQAEAAKKVTLSATKKTLEPKTSFNLSIKNAKGTIKWSTSNVKVAAIKKVSKTKYRVSAGVPGTATISVKVAKKTYKCKVTVKGLNVTSKTLNVGQKLSLTATNVGKKVSWSTSAKSVATIKASKNKCTVTAKAAGKATITAKVGKKKYTCTVIVSNPKQSAASVTLDVGANATVKLTGVQSGTKVTWTAPNAAVVKAKKVNTTTYQITGVTAGTATLKATVNGKAFTWKITVQEPKDETGKTEGVTNGGEDQDGGFGEVY